MLTASSSLFLEPWLNLFCLLGAVLLFDGDRIRGQDGGARWGTFWAGACFGFAAAIKIWAVIPALVAWALCLLARRGRVWFAGGFAAGIAVPCLPFLALAPSGFGRTVFFSELVQATHGRVGANPRVADITGMAGCPASAWTRTSGLASRRRRPGPARRRGLAAGPQRRLRAGLVRAGRHHQP